MTDAINVMTDESNEDPHGTHTGTRTPLLELVAIRKEFGGIVAAADVSFSLYEGEVVALVGNNGAGKSTLMNMVSGVYPPTSGQLLVRGQPVHLSGPAGARALGIETVYQELALVDNLSVFANLCLGREPTRGWKWASLLNRRAMKSRAWDLLGDIGVTLPSITRSVRSLSGGQRQGVALARAVGWGHSIVVLDEPTAALGVEETQHVEAIIAKMAAQNLGVLLVSHDLEQVFRVADRIIVMRRGGKVAEVRKSEVTLDTIVGYITGAVKGHGGTRIGTSEGVAEEETGTGHGLMDGGKELP